MNVGGPERINYNLVLVRLFRPRAACYLFYWPIVPPTRTQAQPNWYGHGVQAGMPPPTARSLLLIQIDNYQQQQRRFCQRQQRTTSGENGPTMEPVCVDDSRVRRADGNGGGVWQSRRTRLEAVQRGGKGFNLTNLRQILNKCSGSAVENRLKSGGKWRICCFTIKVFMHYWVFLVLQECLKNVSYTLREDNSVPKLNDLNGKVASEAINPSHWIFPQ